MGQVQMENWEMDVWKINEFNSLNEEVEPGESKIG